LPILINARQPNLGRTTCKFDRVDLSVNIYNSKKDRARTLTVEVDASEHPRSTQEAPKKNNIKSILFLLAHYLFT
jgi:hypothetical protein